MIHTQISLFFHSSLCNFSASFFPSILEKIVNGARSQKRHSTWTQKTAISPACTLLSDSAARGGDLSAHSIYLFTSGMPCISWGNVRLPRPFATFTGGQSPNATTSFTALPKRFNPEDVSTFYIWAPSSLLASSLTKEDKVKGSPGIAEMLAHCAALANANQALEKCSKLWLMQQKERKKNEDIKQCLSSLHTVCFVYSYEGHWAK